MVRATLERTPTDEPLLTAFATSLRAALERESTAALALLTATRALLASGPPPRLGGELLAGVANVAGRLGAADIELTAQTSALDLFRQAPLDEQLGNHLYTALYNLGVLLFQRNDYAAAVPIIEEALEMAPAADVERLQAALTVAHDRAGETPITLGEAIAHWRAGAHDERGLAVLLTLVANLTIATLQADDQTARMALATEVTALRSAAPHPIAGAEPFLALLQMRLRGEAIPAELRATLPANLQATLSELERTLAGEDIPVPPPPSAPNITPAESRILDQVMPAVQAAIQTLSNPQALPGDRFHLAVNLERMATQAAEGEQPGSPWLDAALGLRALAAIARRQTPTLEALTPLYRSLVAEVLSFVQA